MAFSRLEVRIVRTVPRRLLCFWIFVVVWLALCLVWPVGKGHLFSETGRWGRESTTTTTDTLTPIIVNIEVRRRPAILPIHPMYARSMTFVRQSIKKEMTGYEFQTANQTQEDLIMEEGGEPIRSLIFATWRTGSTFLGEALLNHPGTFYFYEPMSYLKVKQVRSGHLAKEAARVIRQLLSCDYFGLDDHIEFGRTHPWLDGYNKRLWKACTRRRLCWDAKYLSAMCKLFPFQTLKTVRMRLRLAESLLQNEKFSKLRLLLLVRDPRAIIHSRARRDWCPSHPDCYDPGRLCTDMVEDFQAAEKFRVQYPGRFLAVRYEDMALNASESMRKIFNFFRLQYHPQVEEYVERHTSYDDLPRSVWSTYRDSKRTPFRWKAEFIDSFPQLLEIQRTCGEAMRVWGYVPAKDGDDLLTFSPLKSAPWPEMLGFGRNYSDEALVKVGRSVVPPGLFEYRGRFRHRRILTFNSKIPPPQ